MSDDRTAIDTGDGAFGQHGQTVHGSQTNIAGPVHGPVLSGQFGGPVVVNEDNTEKRQVGLYEIYSGYLKARACRLSWIAGATTSDGRDLFFKDVYEDVKAIDEKGNTGRVIERLDSLLGQIEEPMRGVLLLGDTGSGKTMAMNYLACALVTGQDSLLTANLQSRLVLRLNLRDVITRHIPAGAGSGRAQMLLDALKEDLSGILGEDSAEELLKYLQVESTRRGVLLLLDGFDELPLARDDRARLLEAIDELSLSLFALQGSTQSSARGAFTIMAARLSDDLSHHLPGFSRLVLQPYDEVQIDAFIDKCSAACSTCQGTDEAAAQLKLWAKKSPSSAQLASNPMFLAMVSSQCFSGRALPDDRVELYEQVINLMLDRSSLAQETDDGEKELKRGSAVAAPVSLDRETLRSCLEALAFASQQRQIQDTKKRRRPQPISKGDVYAAFETCLVRPVDMLTLLEQSGFLIPQTPSGFALPQRCFQEYMAARYLLRQPDLIGGLKAVAVEDPVLWREVILLALSRLAKQTEYTAIAVLHMLLPDEPGKVNAKTEMHWMSAALVGNALQETPPKVPAKVDIDRWAHAVILHRGKDWLVRMLAEGHLSALERMRAGDALAELDDPRFHVDTWYLPEEPLLGFIEVRKGSFLMGTRKQDKARLVELYGEVDDYEKEMPQSKVYLPTYFIARYPVTVAQFRTFLTASQLEPKFRQCLDGISNHPVVWVTFSEALEYCKWLNKLLCDWKSTPKKLATLLRSTDWEVTLPSEAQWEKAARGPKDERDFPWNDALDTDRANYGDVLSSGTSAVGCFPRGASYYGCLDMSGNVWEWTRSLCTWTYPYPSDESQQAEREDVTADVTAPDGIRRSLRGGAFYNEPFFLRCTARVRGRPWNADGDTGFRIALCRTSKASQQQIANTS